jgi:hypothetical protein
LAWGATLFQPSPHTWRSCREVFGRHRPCRPCTLPCSRRHALAALVPLRPCCVALLSSGLPRSGTVSLARELLARAPAERGEPLRKVFEDAEAKSPPIIFMDEIDAIAPNREKKWSAASCRSCSRSWTGFASARRSWSSAPPGHAPAPPSCGHPRVPPRPRVLR